MINFTALIELELDFSDEDVEFADRSELDGLVQKIKQQINQLISTFEYGNAVKMVFQLRLSENQMLENLL